MTWLLLYERIPASDPSAHMLLQYLEFADYLGVSPDNDIRWDIPVSNKMPGGLPEKYVVLNIGATKPANRWTPEGFAILSDAIRQRFNISSVLTGGPEDAGLAEQILSINNAAINLVGKTSIPELTSVLNNSACVVTCDTGPMHLAVALGRKVVALFGPSDPRRTGPYKGRVVRSGLSCAPCNRKTCEIPACMDAIRPEAVFRILSEEIGDVKLSN